MTSNRPLSFSVTHQGESPGFVKGLLTVDRSWRLFPMTQAESEAVAELVQVASGKKGAVLIWLSSEDIRFNPLLSEAHCFSVAQGDDDSAPEQRFATYRAAGNELALAIRSVWNSFDSLQAVPSDSGSVEVMTELVERASSGEDEVRVGLDWQNRWYFRQNGGCLAFLGSVLGIAGFLLRLMFKRSYRRELMDPFLRTGDMALARDHGAVLWKGGPDESIGLEFLTSKRDIVDEVERIFESHGMTIVTSEHSREAHW